MVCTYVEALQNGTERFGPETPPYSTERTKGQSTAPTTTLIINNAGTNPYMGEMRANFSEENMRSLPVPNCANRTCARMEAPFMWCVRTLRPSVFPRTERNVPDRKHHLIPRNGPRVKVQLGLQLHSQAHYFFRATDRNNEGRCGLNVTSQLPTS